MDLQKISEAIYTINRHAKTAPEPQHLYFLKKEAITRLLKENRAKKIGLHFSKHPKNSRQHSTLLVKVGEYFFHILPTRKDFKKLKHLGNLDQSYRNPRAKMPLSKAKKIIYQYIDWQPRARDKKQTLPSRFYIPSSLGQRKWPPTKS